MTVASPSKNGRTAKDKPKAVRVAAYARISVADREATPFSSVQAQVEAIAAYVASQKAEGWEIAGEPYVDDGFSGATSERPALARLLDDAAQGRIDLVVVHRFDRFSRSQRDFLNLLHVLEEHGVSFASVSQQLDTSTPMGRCMLNVMTAFAQMEREVIAERTRDKMIAARRKGLWTGGRPVLGYDVVEKSLVVNEDEAERVRVIFQLYLDLGSLIPVVEELRRRAWKTKEWTNQKGVFVRGHAFTKTTLHGLLTNPLYAGKVRAGDEIHDGVHEAIVDEAAWDAVQARLTENKSPERRPRRTAKRGALLAGLTRCACGSSMTHHFTTKGDRRYRYYVCARQQKQGAATCPGSRVAAGELEAFVLDRIREVGRDPKVLEATIEADLHAQQVRRPELIEEKRRLATERSRIDKERDALVKAVTKGGKGAPALAEHLGEKDEELRALEQRQDEVREELAAIDTGNIDPDALGDALADLEPIWDALFPAERARVLALLVERITFDAEAGEVEVAFRPGGPKALTTEAAG